MTKESAVAKYPALGRRRPGAPLIRVDFVNRTKLPDNVIRFPETISPLTIIRPEQKLAEVTEFPQQKQSTETPAIEKPEADPIEKVKQSEAYNPSKKKKSYMDEIARLVVRRRRSGCRCTDKDNMDTPPCRSRFCAKKQKGAKLGDQTQRSARVMRMIGGGSNRVRKSSSEYRKKTE